MIVMRAVMVHLLSLQNHCRRAMSACHGYYFARINLANTGLTTQYALDDVLCFETVESATGECFYNYLKPEEKPGSKK